MIIEVDDPEDFLEHFGVKGMRWGQRKDQSIGVSKKTSREAKKDAVESARAKLFYGEGAGTRRKLINASVEAKSKRDPDYKKAFDHHLGNQDLSVHASKARGERTRTDRKTKNKQRVGFVARKMTGEMGTQAAMTAAVIAGGAFVASPKGQATMRKAYASVKVFANSGKARRTTDFLSDYFARQG